MQLLSLGRWTSCSLNPSVAHFGVLGARQPPAVWPQLVVVVASSFGVWWGFCFLIGHKLIQLFCESLSCEWHVSTQSSCLSLLPSVQGDVVEVFLRKWSRISCYSLMSSVQHTHIAKTYLDSFIDMDYIGSLWNSQKIKMRSVHVCENPYNG